MSHSGAMILSVRLFHSDDLNDRRGVGRKLGHKLGRKWCVSFIYSVLAVLK